MIKISHIRYSYETLKHKYHESIYNKQPCPHCHQEIKDKDGGWFIRFYGLCMSCELKRLTHKLKENKTPINYDIPF